MARIKIGSCYIARLSKGEAPVRIESVHEDGGWVAKTLLTSRITRIKDKNQILEPYDPEALEETPSVVEETPETPEPVIESETVEEPASIPEETPTPGETEDIYDVLRRKPRRTMTLLEAAHRVLTEYGGDLSVGDIITAAQNKGYWQTAGKTPANTLCAAMTREIKSKGTASRFVKSERGRFKAKAE